MSHSVKDISIGELKALTTRGCQGRHEFSQTRLDLQALDCFVLGAFPAAQESIVWGVSSWEPENLTAGIICSSFIISSGHRL